MLKNNFNSKFLLITEYLPHYRIPIYNLLAHHLNLTVIHSQPELKESTFNFKNFYINKKSIGPFSYFKTNLNKLCKNFDVIIAEGNIRFIDRNFLILWPWRKYKWISWGIGQAASHNKKLGDKDFFKKFRLFLQKKCDANLLYSNYPLKMHIDASIDIKSIFVAHNTISLDNVAKPNKNKDSILFIGTLYKQKKLEELIEAYDIALRNCSRLGHLVIIGDGLEKVNLEKYVNYLGLEKHILFVGNIENSKILSKYFSNALVCISPGQAGLSVLVSMANSVPFITRKDAITGGEIFNIMNENSDIGIVYDNKDELIALLCDTVHNKEKFIKMGKEARRFYVQNRLPQHMVKSMLQATNYVLQLPDK